MPLISETPEYRSWENMIQRCTNPKYPWWPNYGGRGIRVCQRWRVFGNFLTDMGDRPPGTSLDRIDVNGNYVPGNCRWATQHEQARNTRRNINLTIDGETRCLKDWAAFVGLRYNTIVIRLMRGWSVEDALFTPKVTKSRYGNQHGTTYDSPQT